MTVLAWLNFVCALAAALVLGAQLDTVIDKWIRTRRLDQAGLSWAVVDASAVGLNLFFFARSLTP